MVVLKGTPLGTSESCSEVQLTELLTHIQETGQEETGSEIQASRRRRRKKRMEDGCLD